MGWNIDWPRRPAAISTATSASPHRGGAQALLEGEIPSTVIQNAEYVRTDRRDTGRESGPERLHALRRRGLPQLHGTARGLEPTMVTTFCWTGLPWGAMGRFAADLDPGATTSTAAPSCECYDAARVVLLVGYVGRPRSPGAFVVDFEHREGVMKRSGAAPCSAPPRARRTRGHRDGSPRSARRGAGTADALGTRRSSGVGVGVPSRPCAG